ncbi:galectin-3b [Hippoglossus stenolepis]|uniref:galectin-3b n=1 Tax=Hippoglossus stenolepis TaxID=195615 RepID=UPI00159C6C71|nr:galectin-3b [Hippoglossus stenolepis]
MDLSAALGDFPSGDNQSGGGAPTWPGQSNPAWPGGSSGGGGGGMWPGGNPSQPPTAPGGWPSPAPGPGPAPGGWPSPAPGPGPAPGGWPSPAPGPAPGGWPSPAPGPVPGPGGWPSPAPGPVPGGWPSPAPGPGPGPGGWPSPAPGPGPGPGGWPSPAHGPGPGPGPTFPTAPQQILSVPYEQNLPNGVYDKLLITIAGTVKPNANKITVNLRMHKDLAFHFNPRFNEGGKKVVVRNSCIRDKWGQEERALKHFPFVQGQAFEMKIMCTNREFKVAVNNSHLLEFKHRVTNLRSINKLCISNDLTLSRVHMETVS